MIRAARCRSNCIPGCTVTVISARTVSATVSARSPGGTLTVDEIDGALAEIAHHDPLIVVSGITTEPLTHPDAAGIIRAIRSRNLKLGLYTKGLRFDAACIDALLQGDAECFITFSLDAFNAADYQALHAIKSGGAGRGEGTAGENYFDSRLQQYPGSV